MISTINTLSSPDHSARLMVVIIVRHPVVGEVSDGLFFFYTYSSGDFRLLDSCRSFFNCSFMQSAKYDKKKVDLETNHLDFS